MNKNNKKGVDLFNWRSKNILDATNFIEPEKVPVGLDYLNWPYGYAGVTLEDVIDDPEKNAKEYCKFMNDIEIDFTMNSGFYEPYDAYIALGSDAYSLCADKTTVQHRQAGHKFMTDEEYDILIKNFEYFSGEYMPKTHVPAFSKPKKEAYEMLKKAAIGTAKCAKVSDLIAEIAICDHQIIPLWGSGPPAAKDPTNEDKRSEREKRIASFNMRDYTSMYYAPIDYLFDKYRGMENIFIDLYENEEVLEAACNEIWRTVKSKVPQIPTNEFIEKPFPMGATVYHAASFLNPEQYDKYWFQGFKEQMLPLAEKGLKIYLKGEGAFLHTIERFKEFPKGSVVIQLDSDDPIEANKLIGGHQVLCTGMRTSMLMNYKKQECFDHIKRIFDELAPGGGFLFYQDMPLYSPSDAKPEVVREVWEFVNELSRGRA